MDDHTTFRTWLIRNGGYFHPDAVFKSDSSGFHVVADKYIPPDIDIARCPFSLVVSPDIARNALADILAGDSGFDEWSERQLMCAYLCLHYAFDEAKLPASLSHLPYLKTLPRAEQLLTPLHFTPDELDALKGTNLYRATLDRLQSWKDEWQVCVARVAQSRKDLCNEITWIRYLTVSTYISSRAFPSTLFSQNPSLVGTPASYPILIPAVDALNHARAHPVSWVVSQASPTSSRDLAISLVIRTPTPGGAELLNNYGPKPNSELILGYGFSQPWNPDDTIVLSIGGGARQSSSEQGARKEWEVGRNARGVEELWQQVVDMMSQASSIGSDAEGGAEDEDEDVKWVEDQLDAAGMLSHMCQAYLDRLPDNVVIDETADMRPPVRLMIGHYLEGQRDILESIMRFAQGKEDVAIELARQKGIQLNFG